MFEFHISDAEIDHGFADLIHKVFIKSAERTLFGAPQLYSVAAADERNAVGYAGEIYKLAVEPCPSGITFIALPQKTRVIFLTCVLGKDLSFSTNLFHSVMEYAERHLSMLTVMTMGEPSSSLNFAGKKTRFFESRLCV